MAKATIPVYDICTIDQQSHQDLLIEPLDAYLEKHYAHLYRPHRHSFYHFVLFTNGKGSHSIDFEKFTVQPYQMYFMIPGQVHSWHFEGNIKGFVVHFNEVLFTSFLQNSHYLERFSFFGGISSASVCQLPVSIHSAVVALLNTLIQEMAQSKGGNIDLIRLKLLELFITVERNTSIQQARSVPHQKQLLLRNFQQLIDKHFRTIRLPKEYAGLLYITPNHLNALCQDVVGKTAGDLIRERMLLEAKRLLTNADMTVTEIAYDLQFEDNSYFNRFFKKNVGMTPDEFRKQYIHQ